MVLSIKTFDDGLGRALKSSAALKGISMQELLEGIVASAIGVETPVKTGKSPESKSAKSKR